MVPDRRSLGLGVSIDLLNHSLFLQAVLACKDTSLLEAIDALPDLITK